MAAIFVWQAAERSDASSAVRASRTLWVRPLVVGLAAVVVFATDGFVEAPGAKLGYSSSLSGHSGGRKSSVVGFRRFDESIARWAARRTSAGETMEGIWSDLRDWSGGEFPHDDVTLVVVRVPIPEAKLALYSGVNVSN
jgi:hypothetical protein